MLNARLMGADPTAFRVHVLHRFRGGMDYIFTIGFPLGFRYLVSTAPPQNEGFPRYSHIYLAENLASTDIPESFNPNFSGKLHVRLQADALPLSYSRISCQVLRS